MKQMKLSSTLIALAAAAALAGCNSQNGAPTPTGPPVGSQAYHQIELLARPAVKEGLEVFADHDATNRSEPYNDPTLQADILNFMENTAGRSTAISTTVQSILYPNELAVDLSQTGDASYLGVETGGLTTLFTKANNGKFGGRALTDDVITIDLQAVFGGAVPLVINTLKGAGTLPDDNKENNCLVTDNVTSGQGGVQASTTFPYLVAPH